MITVVYVPLMLTRALDTCAVALATSRTTILTLCSSLQVTLLTQELKAASPKLHQHTKYTNRGANTPDQLYSSIKLAYRAKQLALGTDFSFYNQFDSISDSKGPGSIQFLLSQSESLLL